MAIAPTVPFSVLNISPSTAGSRIVTKSLTCGTSMRLTMDGLREGFYAIARKISWQLTTHDIFGILLFFRVVVGAKGLGGISGR